MKNETVEIRKEKVEVVKQVRLTPKQRLTLVQMQITGGRAETYVDWTARHDLQALGLIEERPRHREPELKALREEINKLWKSIPPMVHQKSADALDRAVDQIRAKTRSLDEKAWWLTAAANEYLVKGRVVITR